MKNFYFVITLLLITANPFASSGQKGDIAKTYQSIYTYKVKSTAIRKEVWAWEIPAFSNYSVPEEYANESAVILARHRHIEAAAEKSSFKRSFFYGTKSGQLTYVDTDRWLIKINDQSALDNFSEFSFKEREKFGQSMLNSNVLLTIFGARVIKTDGTINEIDISQEAVSMTEGKANQEAYKKIAIPGMQKGDILDVFICEIYELETFNIPEQIIPFYTIDSPALNYSCQLTFGPNLTVEYRSINGAPLLEKTTDEDGNIELRAREDEIMRINDIENLRWLSSARDLPAIRFVVLQNASKVFLKPDSARPLGVHENVSSEDIIDDATWFMAYHKGAFPATKNLQKKVYEIINNYKNDNPELSAADLADVIYASLNYEWRGTRFNSGIFILLLDQFFKENGIESKIGFTTNKYDARAKEVVASSDLYYVITADNGSRIFFGPSWNIIPGMIPPGLQGEEATTFPLHKIGNNPFSSPVFNVNRIDTGPKIIVEIPESSPEENVNITSIEVSILPGNNHKLSIKRNSKWTGALMADMQSLLILYEDWETEIRKYLGIDKGIIDELNEKRKTRKFTEQMAGIFEKARNGYSETIESEIVLYHNTNPDEVMEYSFSGLGLTKARPELEYEISYIMDGFIRTAQDNILLDAGKLIGIQWDPTDNDRNRNVDAYIPTARIFSNEILINIPEGYIVDDISHMNVNYCNEYMAFETNTTIEDGKIFIEAQKSYLKAFIPKEDWAKLIEIADKANDFYSSSIILKKIKEH